VISEEAFTGAYNSPPSAPLAEQQPVHGNGIAAQTWPGSTHCNY